jgi:hypothetical protein
MDSRRAGMAVTLSALVPLNLIYVWSSGVYSWVPILDPVDSLLAWLFLSRTLTTLTEFDTIPLALWLLVVLGSLLWFRGRGHLATGLMTIRVSAAALIPLPAEIYVFDTLNTGSMRGRQFNVQVIAAQSTFHMLPWFTNADLLYSATAAVAATTAVLFWLGRRTRGFGSSDGPGAKGGSH